MPQPAAAPTDLRQEAIEVTHGAGGQVVQDHERPGLDGELGKGRINPPVRVLPITRRAASRPPATSLRLRAQRGGEMTPRRSAETAEDRVASRFGLRPIRFAASSPGCSGDV